MSVVTSHAYIHAEMTRHSQQTRIRSFAFILAALGALALAGCSSYPPLRPAAEQASDAVRIDDHGDYLLVSARAADSDEATHGIIFYPGGLVEPESYVSLLAPLAEDGIPVAILRVPFDLAVFAVRRAEAVLGGADGELADSWVLAGHSLGGAMAARFLARHAGNYSSVVGLILIAAYPADNDPLSELGYPVLSIWASEDGLATADEREETAGLLPADATVAVIDGGNHAGFGEYGPQKDDGQALIPRSAQHQRTRELIRVWLQDRRL